MTSEKYDLSSDLIGSMDASHASEFENLLSKFSSNARIKEFTTLGLFKIARAGYSEASILAIKLIGGLNVTRAESELLGILETDFPEQRMQDLAVSPNKYLPEHKFMTSLLTALLVLGSKEGSEIAIRTQNRFAGSWINSYLEAVQKGRQKNS